MTPLPFCLLSYFFFFFNIVGAWSRGVDTMSRPGSGVGYISHASHPPAALGYEHGQWGV